MIVAKQCPTYESRQFSFSNQTFVAERSDLCGPLREGRNLTGVHYVSGQPHRAFNVRNAQGDNFVWIGVKEETDEEGETLGWRFRPCPGTARNLKGCTLLVIND